MFHATVTLAFSTFSLSSPTVEGILSTLAGVLTAEDLQLALRSIHIYTDVNPGEAYMALRETLLRED